MSLTTLLICDDIEKRESLEALIKSQPSLLLVGSVSRQAASKYIVEKEVKVIWVELKPEPAQGLKLFTELSLRHPEAQFLVSHDELQADLVKGALQLGAVEYLDAKGMSRLLPPAIERIEKNAAKTPVHKPPIAQISPDSAHPPVGPPSPTVIPQALGNAPRAVSRMRSKTSQLDSAPGGLPYWLLPSIILVLLLIVMILFFTLH